MKNIINNNLKSIAHAINSNMSYQDRWNQVVKPAVQQIREIYRETSRKLLGDVLESHLFDGAKFDLSGLVDSYIDVREFFDKASALTGLTSLDAPAFINIRVRGADGQPAYVDYADIKSLKSDLSSMSDDELMGLLRSLKYDHLKQWAVDAMPKVLTAVSRLKMYYFDMEDGVHAESAWDIIAKEALKRANAGKDSAHLLLCQADLPPMKFAGGMKAIAGIALGKYAMSHLIMERVRENARIAAEAAYVRKTEGGSYLVESKNGERPGSASGRDGAHDIDRLRGECSDSNYDELETFIADMAAIMQPVERYTGDLTIYWSDELTLSASQFEEAFAAKVKGLEDFFRTLDQKGEGYRDKIVAARLEVADTIGKRYAENREAMKAELLG